MRFLLAEYAQRLLFTVFLTAFGAYLLIAMLTYTPYDPGWSHLSSDTLQVTNASGVAGAWIADLMYGFLGRASLLVPVMVLLEAVNTPRGILLAPAGYVVNDSFVERLIYNCPEMKDERIAVLIPPELIGYLHHQLQTKGAGPDEPEALAKE